jgi:nucleoside-diphosphate-sugar epimerase
MKTSGAILARRYYDGHEGGDMNPVSITGATGYVGRPLIEALLAGGRDVHRAGTPRVGAVAVERLPDRDLRIVEAPEIQRAALPLQSRS